MVFEDAMLFEEMLEERERSSLIMGVEVKSLVVVVYKHPVLLTNNHINDKHIRLITLRL